MDGDFFIDERFFFVTGLLWLQISRADQINAIHADITVQKIKSTIVSLYLPEKRDPYKHVLLH